MVSMVVWLGVIYSLGHISPKEELLLLLLFAAIIEQCHVSPAFQESAGEFSNSQF